MAEPPAADLPPLRLVLAGGGHAHIQIVRELSPKHLASACGRKVHLELVSEATTAYYSGMVPAAVAGLYRDEECLVELDTLCAAHGWAFTCASVTNVVAAAKMLVCSTADGSERRIPYHVLSLNVGSRTQVPFPLPDDRRCIKTRPISDLNGKVSAALAEWSNTRLASVRQPHVVVVGGGAAGVELAFSTYARASAALGSVPAVSLVSSSARVLGHDQGHNMASHVEAAASDRDIELICGRHVEAVHLKESDDDNTETGPLTVELAGDATLLDADLVIVATGAAPHPWMENAADLPKDPRGFIRVDDNLHVPGLDNVYAAGDCASLDRFEGAFPPKAGVYAVRSGPVLIHNLRAALLDIALPQTKHALEPFHPQRSYLSLLTLGDGTAIGTKWGFAFTGRWVWHLKSHIDTKWMKSFAK